MTVSGNMRDDEAFVIDALAEAFSGAWSPSEKDPPDAYLTVGTNIVAIEVSTLTQYVAGDRGTRPRFSDDAATAALANGLNTELQYLIPDGHTIVLGLSSPILKYHKTKTELAKRLRGQLPNIQSFATDTKIEIYGNPITISRNHHGEAHKKVMAVFPHRNSSADILSNARNILEERINVKAKKCAEIVGTKPLWLALLNDYWLADASTYKHVLSFFSPAHPFEKILLVNGNGTLEPIFEL